MRTLTVALASLLCVATGLIGEDAPAVPPPVPAPAPEKTAPAADAVKPADVEKRLDAIIIPKFDFRQATATEIVKFLDSCVTTLGGEVEKKDETRVKIVADFGKGGDTLPAPGRR